MGVSPFRYQEIPPLLPVRRQSFAAALLLLPLMTTAPQLLRAPPRRPDAATGRGFPAMEALAAVVVLAFVLQPWLTWLFAGPAVQTWSTIFVSLVFQALPFLVLGVLLSGAVAAFLPQSWMERLLPTQGVLAVPAAGLAGTVMPGCECGAVPVAGRLIARGAPPAAALTFLLAAPAVNPVVLASTLVAFPGQPRVALARLLASFATAVAVGFWWRRFGRDGLLDGARRHDPMRPAPWATFRSAAVHDFVHAGGFLVVGAGVVALLQTAVPRTVLDSIPGGGPGAVAALAVLAVVVSICSEADAFVAASLSQFSLTARLAFMVVGPVVDLKLISMQAGTFGRGFAARFAPVCLLTSVTSATVIGTWLL